MLPILGMDLTFTLCESNHPGYISFHTESLSGIVAVAQCKPVAPGLARFITGVTLYLEKLRKPKRPVHSLSVFKPWTGCVDNEQIQRGLTIHKLQKC